MIKNIVLGVEAYFGAFSLISKLKLWKYFAIPMLISVLIAVLLGVSAYSLSDNIGDYISKFWVWQWGKETIAALNTIISGLGILLIGLLLYKHLIMALSAPFMSPISEKIEAHLGGPVYQHRSSSFSQQLWRGIRINVRNLGMELFLTLPILIISFIPIIGIIATVLLFLIQAYYAGFGNMDYTLERHYTYSESIQFVRKHRGLAIGNGLVFILFLFIPIIGVIGVLPFSVTAATTKTVKAIQLKSNKLHDTK